MSDKKRSFDAVHSQNSIEKEINTTNLPTKIAQRTDDLADIITRNDNITQQSASSRSSSLPLPKGLFSDFGVHPPSDRNNNRKRSCFSPRSKKIPYGRSTSTVSRNSLDSSSRIFGSSFQAPPRAISEKSIAKSLKMSNNQNSAVILAPTSSNDGISHFDAAAIESPNKAAPSTSLFGAVMSRFSGPTPTHSDRRDVDYSSSSKKRDDSTTCRGNFNADLESEFYRANPKNYSDNRNSTIMLSQTIPNNNDNDNNNNHGSILLSPENRKNSSRWSIFPTPTRPPSSSNSNSAFSFTSPGGYALLKILEQAQTADAFTSCDNYEDNENYDESLLTKENNDDGNNFNNSNNKSKSKIEDDWYYSRINWRSLIPKSTTDDLADFLAGDSSGVLFLDKSIKRRIRIECHPGTCLPGNVPLSQLPRTLLLEQKAMSLFLLSSSSVGDFDFGSSCHGVLAPLSLSEQAIVRWMSATMYWQHPATHPLPREILLSSHEQHQLPFSSSPRRSNKSLSSSSTRGSSAQLPQSFIKSLLQQSASLFKHVRSVSGVGGMGGLGHSVGACSSSFASVRDNNAEKKNKNAQHDNFHNGPTMSHFMFARQKEWQESFRSIYLVWMERIDQWNEQMIHNKETIVVNIPMFYALGLGQTVLFTCARPSSSNGGLLYFAPQILISSTTRSLRDTLRRDYDVSLYVSDGKMFEEQDDIHPTDDDVDNMTADDTENMQELKALRDASHVGADVMILSPHPVRRRQRNIRQDGRCALIIYGKKDCHAFYEFYLNKTGNLLQLQNNNRRVVVPTKISRNSIIDVPLLLSRSLGPTLHTCLSRLSVTSRKMQSNDNRVMNESSSSNNNGGDETSSYNSSIELRGPLLPCCVRELLASSVLTLHADCGSDEKTQEERSNNADNNDDVGSHYFVAHLQTHEGESMASSSKNIVSGDPSSLLFNGHHGSCGPNGLDECAIGQVMSVVVWDSARPESFSYNVDSISTLQDSA